VFVYNRYAISHQQKWLEHLQSMGKNRTPTQALQFNSKAGRNLGHPRERWKDQLRMKQDTHTHTRTHARLKRCESDWHRSIIKRTLHEEQCTFSSLSRLPSKGFFWKFICGTVHKVHTLSTSYHVYLTSP
jgi:hypothetical protein